MKDELIMFAEMVLTTIGTTILFILALPLFAIVMPIYIVLRIVDAITISITKTKNKEEHKDATE